MISSTAFTPKLPLNVNLHDPHPGLSSVFAAAVVNHSFCEMLLKEPEKAIKQAI